MFFINLATNFKTRYDPAKFLEFVILSYANPLYDVLGSYFWKQLKTLSVKGTYQVRGEDNRPDLISYRIYGNTQYWWIILLYNNLTSNEDIVGGMTLNYPALIDLETLYFQLNSLQRK
jgi:hypothetical protein